MPSVTYSSTPLRPAGSTLTFAQPIMPSPTTPNDLIGVIKVGIHTVITSANLPSLFKNLFISFNEKKNEYTIELKYKQSLLFIKLLYDESSLENNKISFLYLPWRKESKKEGQFSLTHYKSYLTKLIVKLFVETEPEKYNFEQIKNTLRITNYTVFLHLLTQEEVNELDRQSELNRQSTRLNSISNTGYYTIATSSATISNYGWNNTITVPTAWRLAF